MATASEFPTMYRGSSNLCEALSLFKQKLQLYNEEEEIADPAAQARKIFRGLGDESLKRLNASGLSVDDKFFLDIPRNPIKSQHYVSNT